MKISVNKYHNDPAERKKGGEIHLKAKQISLS